MGVVNRMHSEIAIVLQVGMNQAFQIALLYVHSSGDRIEGMKAGIGVADISMGVICVAIGIGDAIDGGTNCIVIGVGRKVVVIAMGISGKVVGITVTAMAIGANGMTGSARDVRAIADVRENVSVIMGIAALMVASVLRFVRKALEEGMVVDATRTYIGGVGAHQVGVVVSQLSCLGTIWPCFLIGTRMSRVVVRYAGLALRFSLVSKNRSDARLHGMSGSWNVRLVP